MGVTPLKRKKRSRKSAKRSARKKASGRDGTRYGNEPDTDEPNGTHRDCNDTRPVLYGQVIYL